MTITNKRVTVLYYHAECPICGHEFVWLRGDFKKRSIKCGECEYTAPAVSYPYEKLGEAEILFTDEGVRVISD